MHVGVLLSQRSQRTTFAQLIIELRSQRQRRRFTAATPGLEFVMGTSIWFEPRMCDEVRLGVSYKKVGTNCCMFANIKKQTRTHTYTHFWSLHLSNSQLACCRTACDVDSWPLGGDMGASVSWRGCYALSWSPVSSAQAWLLALKWTRVVFLALLVNVNLELRKTRGTW